ncbi:hypothetical protein DD237_006339 [Peronospora effusa]|uniref:Uncharacterized protein n=1 Tax=Peronospora effusa TaxID=542832 RepID=A0A3R7YW66_9STRA|nr:hypothetical protein DD237_006339 [Peronospora effusa]
MARQVDVATRSLGRLKLFYTGAPSPIRTCCFFSSISSCNASNSESPTLSKTSSITHQSLVTSVPNLQALQHIRWLLQQPQRRILFLTGSSASDSSVRAALERDSPVFELERHGHGVFSVREFCQLLLREHGHERRVFGHAQLAALLMHSSQDLPSVARLTATSMLQKRKVTQDLLQLFQLLEREGIAPEEYSVAVAASGEPLSQELSEMYTRFQGLLRQHNATSWDGLVLDMLTMCRVQKGDVENTLAENLSQALVREYTDVVVDDVQRMTPAMAKLVGHLCGQSSVQSSASFSRVLLEGEDCPRTQILERQLLSTAADTGQTCTLNRTAFEIDNKPPRAKMQAFARQVLTQRADINNDVPAPVPLKCWRFGTFEAEEKGISAFLVRKLAATGAINATVVCPTHADALRITLALQKQDLPARVDGEYSAASVSTGAPIHLFDEPGVNAVYSLLCALCFPSDSRHLYNVLRSDCFAFPAELLSWLMEKEHRSHVDLFTVLETFVENHGKSLGTSLNKKEGEKQKLPQVVSCQHEVGLEIAKLFVNIMKHLRTKCHELSAAEIVQSFLERTGRLEKLLSPNSPEEERESLVLADFLRELETAQEVAMSDKIPFVVPYLQQLRETNLTSSASWADTFDVSTKTSAKDACIRVIPLTAYALHSYASSLTDGEEGRKHVLILMSMRDSKFPGRMKRLTLPLPYDLLSEPYPLQTRIEHLEQCQQLAYKALTLSEYDEVVLSFAEFTAISASKHESLSRTFQPIWHEGDQPATGTSYTGGSKWKTESSCAISSRNEQSMSKQSASIEDTSSVQHETSIFSFSEMADLLLDFVNRMLRPFTRLRKSARHDDHRKFVADVSSITKSDDHQAGRYRHIQETPYVKQPKITTSILDPESSTHSTSMDTRLPTASAASASYEPPHLSYSQISEYLRCPHRYYLGRILKLNGDVSIPMMFGSALHEGIAAFAKAMAEAQLKEEVAHEAKALATVKAEKAFMQSWVDDGYGLFTSKEQSSVLFERGMMALRDFMETHFNDLQLEAITHVEQAFSFYVPEANVELCGVWDRIDRVSDPNGGGSSKYIIKEFKSNMGGAERNMGKLARESLQLKMYMYAFCKVFGEAPYGAKLQQIGDNYSDPSSNATKRTRSKRISKAGNDDNGFVLFSTEASQEAEDAIVEVATGLRRGDFEPKPSFAECAFCPYAGSACHFATDDASRARRSARKTRLAVQG